MKQILACLLVVMLSTLAAECLAAKRFGGGGNIGRQSQSITREVPRAPAPQPAQAPGSRGSWLGPLAGLAAGGLLAALFFGHGFSGINVMDILVVVLLVVGAVFLIRALRRGPAPMERSRYAGGIGEAAPGLFGGSSGAQPASGGGNNSRVPPGFDAEGFLREAKRAFLRLQGANDAGDLAELRGYTTPEMYTEIARQINERGSAPQKIEVVTLNGELLEVVTEGDAAIASVRFRGLIREDSHGAAEPFDEVWHVQKALHDPKSTWLVAGIQQAA
jgi:predicted lipid-binding transport protein (Tim44 family)